MDKLAVAAIKVLSWGTGCQKKCVWHEPKQRWVEIDKLEMAMAVDWHLADWEAKVVERAVR